jgi:hypothetical protein
MPVGYQTPKLAVPRWLVAGFYRRRPGLEPEVGHVGFVVDKEELGQVISEYFGFPCQFSFRPLLHTHNHPSSGAGTIAPIMVAVPSGLTLQLSK